jgi:hypothetical protein
MVYKKSPKGRLLLLQKSTIMRCEFLKRNPALDGIVEGFPNDGAE